MNEEQVKITYKNGYEAAFSAMVYHYKTLQGKGVKTVPISKVVSFLERCLRDGDKAVENLVILEDKDNG